MKIPPFWYVQLLRWFVWKELSALLNMGRDGSPLASALVRYIRMECLTIRLLARREGMRAVFKGTTVEFVRD